ncbi:MAG: choice-of-anchor D domain-containing protein [Candidatus Competibacteraceae bacterium]|nr:MAG: choice-of-anchor D domain-containing protein [Candidatus Competibacteraceae bacterium]
MKKKLNVLIGVLLIQITITLLLVASTPALADCPPTQPILPISVNAQVDDSIIYAEDVDYFSFTLPSTGAVTIYGGMYLGEVIKGTLYNSTCTSLANDYYLTYPYSNISFSSLAAGTYVLMVRGNTRSTTGNYWIYVGYAGQSTSPEMDVHGGGISIIDGATSPNVDDDTWFDHITTGHTHTFTIANTGTAPLNLTGTPRVSIIGTHASDFTVTQQPSSPVAVNGSTTFEVVFNPSAGGDRQATVRISNDDSDENPYNFAIAGRSFGGVQVPEITVRGNGQEIVDGDTTPSTIDNTDFGTVDVATDTVTHTFTIANTGTALLNLTGTPHVSLSGAHASDFSITAQPNSPVAVGGTTTFQVLFNPSAGGERQATVRISNDDSDENPYIFAIAGKSLGGVQVPEITVRGNGQEIVDGDTTPSTTDNTDFGTVDVAADTVTHSFVIANDGTAPLNLTGTPRVSLSGAHASDFSITAQPNSPVAVGGTTTFQVVFNPSAEGSRQAIVNISNDDSDENSYSFSIQGDGNGFAFTAISWYGDVYEINPQTGAYLYIGSSGYSGTNSLAVDGTGRLITAVSPSNAPAFLVQIDPVTGVGTPLVTVTGPFVNIYAMAFSPEGELYVSSATSPSYFPALYKIDLDSGQSQFISYTAPHRFLGLDFAPDGTLFGWSNLDGLYTIDTNTGAATDVNPSIGNTSNSLETIGFAPDGTLYGANCDWFQIDSSTGFAEYIAGIDCVTGIAVSSPAASNSPTSLSLAQNQWHLISPLPLDGGGGGTVGEIVGNDILADNLDSAIYGNATANGWIMYQHNALTNLYETLTIDSPLTVGRGYWLKTLAANQSFTVSGNANSITPIDLEAAPTPANGRSNMLGHPYDYNVCWSDAQISNDNFATFETPTTADPGNICDTDPADPTCILSRKMYQWNGAAYQTFDGTTPGAEGVLEPFDGFFVKVFKPGYQLQIPATPSCQGVTAATHATLTRALKTTDDSDPESKSMAKKVRNPDEWNIRLTVSAEGLTDPGNLIGRLNDSRNGHDAHDLDERPADFNPHLTLVFPHHDWGNHAGDYTTDFRALERNLTGATDWDFEIRSDQLRTITLTWDIDNQDIRNHSRLIDVENNVKIKPKKVNRYTIPMVGTTHRFTWRMQAGR